MQTQAMSPTFTVLISLSGTEKVTETLPMSRMVTAGSPGRSEPPALALQLPTTPATGAVNVQSSSCLRAICSNERAFSRVVSISTHFTSARLP